MRTSGPRAGDRVLVTGAAGFLGRSILRRLHAQGYEAVGLVRRRSSADVVRAEGGRAVLGDVRDAAAVRRALRGCRAAVHLAAHPSEVGILGAEHRAVRETGARHLVSVGRSLGVGRVLIGSGYWVYRGGRQEIDETSPIDPIGEARANRAAERAALHAARGGAPEVIVLRPGMVYGPGSWIASMAAGVRDGTYRVIGSGSNHWSFVARSDAASAFQTALERGVPGEVYNVVDGDPQPWGAFVGDLAARLGSRRPQSISKAAGDRRYGKIVAHQLSTNRSARGGKLRALGWRPRTPTYRMGLDRAAERL